MGTELESSFGYFSSFSFSVPHSTAEGPGAAPLEQLVPLRALSSSEAVHKRLRDGGSKRSRDQRRPVMEGNGDLQVAVTKGTRDHWKFFLLSFASMGSFKGRGRNKLFCIVYMKNGLK